LLFLSNHMLQTQSFRKIQIIMTLSVPDEDQINAKCHVDLCYRNELKNASPFYRLVSFPSIGEVSANFDFLRFFVFELPARKGQTD